MWPKSGGPVARTRGRTQKSLGTERAGVREGEKKERKKTPVWKPPARTSESNCWQINAHMVDWLPRLCVCVCERMCPDHHLSGSVPPSQHPSGLPSPPLSSLRPPLSSAARASLSLSAFLPRLNSLTHSCGNATLITHQRLTCFASPARPETT